MRNIGIISAILLLLAAGCARAAPTATPAAIGAATAATATPTLTPRPTETPPPTLTPTPTWTPTPTLTPTPTAVPAFISGDPRAAQLHSPVPSGAAVCGVVDVFDFPIDPPDASRVSSGGQDFGVWRDRYGKYHAGEDWRGPEGTPSLGTPVTSIGHGLVMYAQPLGWGRDQGVVIVQHTLADGSRLLSFYGHLAPDSVVITPGNCVTRGQQVGQIGQPRSSPHLHFEMRTQAPYEPLTGYWPEDPTLAGWLPPSRTIWNQRIAAAPGVQWTRPFVNAGSKGVGPLDDHTFLILEAGQLLTIDLSDGSGQPALPDLKNVSAALLANDQPPGGGPSLLYTADRFGRLDAIRLDAPVASGDGPTFSPLWTIPPRGNGAPLLLPLPTGGVILAQRGELFAYAPTGELLWQQNVGERILGWTPAGEDLFFTTTGSSGALWRLPAGGTPQLIAPHSGYPVTAAGQLWLYAAEGIYRLDLAAAAPTLALAYALPEGSLSRGSIAPMSDGGVLVAHADPYDRRLIALAADGAVRWQRSVHSLAANNLRLLTLEGQPYLLVSSGGDFTLYAIDLAAADVLRLFHGGTRTPVANDIWAAAVDPARLLLNIGGGSLVVFDPQAARAILAP